MRILKAGTRLQEALLGKGVEIVQFGSAGCAPCTALKSKLEVWCRAHPGVMFWYVPLEACPELAAQAGIFTAPAVQIFVEGRLTIQESGYFSLEAIFARLERYLTLMAEPPSERL